ncbi:hypothetical protein ACFX2I_006342 [Malus domestica]
MRPIASSSSPPTWLWPFSIPPVIRSTVTLFRLFSLLHQKIVRWRCGRDFGFNGFDGFEFNGAKLNLQTNDICTQPASMPPLCPVSNVLATIVNLAARLAKKAEARAIFMLAADERSLHNVDDSKSKSKEKKQRIWILFVNSGGGGAARAAASKNGNTGGEEIWHFVI